MRVLLRKASELIARKCDVKTQKVCALALHKGQIIASATNTRGSGGISRFTTHAEEALVKKLWRNRVKYPPKAVTVFVIRELRGGGFGMALPCPDCSFLLGKVGVRSILYTTDLPQVGELFN